ncbi:MAG: ATP-binding cassette domain-containing protein [Rhodocyclaceae bacterium]|jgi:zinc transport system ATP-binding protein|nr:ATP-binding cassette domain-containing protein [Rhodocyclaceae bacterium]
MSGPAIRLEKVSFAYQGIPALEDVSLDVEEGEFLGLVGPNGGGKSTLLRLVLGLLVPDRGRIDVFGEPPARARQALGYVPQFATFRRDFPVTAEETVLLGRLGMTSALFGTATGTAEWRSRR